MTDIPMSDLSLSLLQHKPTPCDLAAGIERIERAAQKATTQGSELLISPECGITGYDMTEQDAQSAAFSIDSPTARQISDIAQRHRIAIAYGFMERAGGKRFNSVQLLSDKGTSLLHYRKTHLWGELDKQLFSAGDRLAPVVSYKGWRISTLICYDVEFPETVRALALAGAQLVLVPTALMSPFRFVAEQMIRVRAAENQIYLAYANLVGQERHTVYEGCSTIADPEGNVLASAAPDETTLLHTVLRANTIKTIRQALPYHQDRRPHLYETLSQSVSNKI